MVEINYFIILFIIFPIIILVGVLYYCVNYLCIVHHHDDEEINSEPYEISNSQVILSDNELELNNVEKVNISIISDEE